MKTWTLRLLFLSLIWAIACDDDDCNNFFFGCSDGPFYGNLTVRVTINSENPEVEVTLFNGRIEDQDTLLQDVIDEKSRAYELEADRYYSGTVYYQDGIKEILVINGRNLPTNTDECDCEYAKNKSLNLKLAR